jgi:hypothetical protein
MLKTLREETETLRRFIYCVKPEPNRTEDKKE